MHLKHPGLLCKFLQTIYKTKERIDKFKETEDSRYIYQNEVD